MPAGGREAQSICTLGLISVFTDSTAQWAKMFARLVKFKSVKNSNSEMWAPSPGRSGTLCFKRNSSKEPLLTSRTLERPIKERVCTFLMIAAAGAHGSTDQEQT